jgi:type II secretory pathway component PulF
MVSSSFKSLKVFRVHSPGKAKKKSFWLLANDLTEARIMAQLQAFIGVESISPVSAFLASMVKLANRLPKEVDFAAIFEKIAKMLSVGFSMEKSLLLQLKLLENPYTRYVLAKILKSLKGGQKLGVAMGSIPGIFSEATLAMIAQAEASNGLTEVLVQIGEHQRMASKILRRTASEMIYPCFVAFAGLVVSIGLGFFFLPTLEIIYESFGAKLPSLTHFLFSVSKGSKAFRYCLSFQQLWRYCWS